MAKLNNEKLVFTISNPEEETAQKQPAPSSEVVIEQINVKSGQTDGGKKKKKEKRLHWYTKFLIFVDICVFICFFVAYGPWTGFRDWLVTTALSTNRHRYFAYVLYSNDMVKEIAERNSLIEPEGQSDLNAIKFVERTNDGHYDNAYEQQVLEREEGADYKVIELKEDNYSGFVTVIYHPERMSLVMCQKPYGEQISSFAKRTGALVAVNGGGYMINSNDVLYTRSNIIVDGKAIKNNHKKSAIIGMSWDGKLMLANQTADEAIANGMKWGVQYGPFLILNGQKTQFSGNGGKGVHPRTAIGQRQDGIVILLTIDGRGANGSSGISLPDLTDILERYGCYNAANLDGGGSTSLVVEGVLRNKPTGWGYQDERYIYNAIIYK
ncbi:MAG: phosphodiester glycosidase family protein [Erysipelotrichaceae bacterium]|nr:phosphodiester glycosidase family protein [Erysipelotrichaceae bacterium]